MPENWLIWFQASIYESGSNEVLQHLIPLKSQSHIATDGLSWCRAPSGVHDAHDHIFI
jgi:hypothetical protein